MIQKTNNEKKIDLCIILSHFPQGGAERQTLYLIQGLLLKEYKVTLILYDANEVFYDEINQLPINIIKKNGRKKNKFLKYIENIFFIRNEIKRQKYDIIHTLLFHNGLWVRIAAWGIYKNRIVYSVRNSVEDYPKVYLFFEKVFIRYSFIVTNSKKSLNQFSKIFKTKYQNRLTNIYNGFEIERFTSQKQVFHNDQIIIGTVGRQTLQKNQIQILRVINIIKNTYKIRFSLIGDKTQNESKRISDYIALNNLSEYVQVLDAQKEIERYYKKFQIFILSSFYEGCPNVLFEAMLSKCLCIISSGANSDNFIKDGVNGLVYDGSDNNLEEKLVEAIKLIQEGKASDMINDGYRNASENFSIERMVNAYEDLYYKILN